MEFTGRVQEKIPHHHLTTEWVFYLYGRDQLPTGILNFFLTFEISAFHLCAFSVQLKLEVTTKYINSTYRKERQFFLTHTEMQVKFEIWLAHP